jgi:hypothetical protein
MRAHGLVLKRVCSQAPVNGGRAFVQKTTAARGYGAGSFLCQLPVGRRAPRRLPDGRDFFGGLSGAEFRSALARRLLMPVLPGYGGRACPLCGKAGAVDALGDHVDSCRGLTAYNTYAHDHGRDALCIIAQEARLRPRLEVTRLDPAAPHRRPADVLLRGDVPHGLGKPGEPTHVGKGVCIDVTQRHILSPTYIEKKIGDVLESAYKAKTERAGTPAGYIPYSVVWTSCGSFHKQSLRTLLSKWSALRWAGTDGEDDEFGIRCAERLLELSWLPRLSAAVQRGWARKVHHLRVCLEGGGAGGVSEELQLSDIIGLDSNLRVLAGT